MDAANRWVFLVATLLGLFSTAQAYRLTTLNPKAHVDGIEIGSLLVLNLTLWYVPAALTAPIFRIAARFRLDADRWLRSIAIHGDRRGRCSRSCTSPRCWRCA